MRVSSSPSSSSSLLTTSKPPFSSQNAPATVTKRLSSSSAAISTSSPKSSRASAPTKSSPAPRAPLAEFLPTSMPSAQFVERRRSGYGIAADYYGIDGIGQDNRSGRSLGHPRAAPNFPRSDRLGRAGPRTSSFRSRQRWGDVPQPSVRLRKLYFSRSAAIPAGARDGRPRRTGTL